MNVEPQENPQSTAGAWFFTVLYCAFSFGMFYFAVTVWKEAMPVLITGFFAAFGVVYIVMTIRQTLGQRKFGTIRFLMERPGPSVGGRLKGSVTLPAGMQGKSVDAELACWKETVAIGRDTASGREPVWTETRSFPIRAKPGGAAASIEFDIPAYLEPTKRKPVSITMVAGDPPRVFWTYHLRVTADVPGVDLDRNYPITVLPANPGAAMRGAAVPAAAAAPAARPEAVVRSAPVAPLSRTMEQEEQEPDSSSLWVLVAANLVPVAGVVFWGWRAVDVIFLYWLENIIIGMFNVLRILTADPVNPVGALRRGGVSVAKIFLAAFFVMHYGGFCLGHGEFLVSFFPIGEDRRLGAAVARALGDTATLGVLAALVASHGYSFFRNYLGRGEFRGVDVGEMMFRPYKRIVVTHIFIIAGGFLLMALRSQAAAMLVFVALKIGFDVYFHRREHRHREAA